MDVAGLLQFSQTYLEVFVGAGAGLIAVICALIARGETRRQRRLQTAGLREDNDAAGFGRGNAAIGTMDRCALFARVRQMQAGDGGFLANKANLRVTLSAPVDQGRLFFPNLTPDRKGAGKEGACRGHRPPNLDALFGTHNEPEALTREGGPSSDDSAACIDECRRLLVSQLQACPDARRKGGIVERFDDQDDNDSSGAIARSKALPTRPGTRRPDVRSGADGVQSTRLQ